MDEQHLFREWVGIWISDVVQVVQDGWCTLFLSRLPQVEMALSDTLRPWVCLEHLRLYNDWISCRGCVGVLGARLRCGVHTFVLADAVRSPGSRDFSDMFKGLVNVRAKVWYVASSLSGSRLGYRSCCKCDKQLPKR